MITQQWRAVGILPDRKQAERALKDLRKATFPMRQISVMAKRVSPGDQLVGLEVQTLPGTNQGDKGAIAGASLGGVLGAITGLLAGVGAIAVPGIGPVLAGGAVADAIFGTLAGSTLGIAAGGLAGVLVGMGIPEDHATRYNKWMVRGGYLLMLEGSEAELSRAETILRRWNVQNWTLYDIPKPQPAQLGASVRNRAFY